MRIIPKISLLTASIVFAAVTGVPVLAMGADSSRASAQTLAYSNQTADHGEVAQTKLTDAKLKACHNHEKAANNVMARLADRGQKQLDLFTKIAERTEAFYKTKGKTLTNYDALVADVAAKKAAAEAEIAKIKDISATFKCDGTDPKGVVASFKENLKAEQAVLKDYKTAVKNLIVGVKSVQGTTTSTNKKTTEGGQQ